MLKQILVFLTSLGIFTNCTNQNSNVIVLKNINEKNNSEIPFEINPKEFTNSENLLRATSVDNSDVSFILQKSSTIHYDGEHTFSAILPKSISNGEYKITHANEESIFSFKETEPGRLTIKEGNSPALSYNFGMQLPENVPERYRRATYIHPVYDLKGNILTDDFPDDHYHHRGLSWMWPKIFADSARYDLWHIYGMEGNLEGIHQVFEKWLFKDVGPVCASIGVKNIWQLDNGQKIMDEWVYIKVYKSKENARAIDIKLIFKANVEIGLEGQTKKGYGGLNFRFAPREETLITSHLGKEEDSDLKSLPWADQSAKFAGNDYFSGASIFQQKHNQNYPAGWCLRHYGFLGVAWPGVVRYDMKPGEKLILSFRIWVHQGNAEDGNVETAHRVFNDPPIIETK